MQQTNFVHLHLHSQYSLLDGAIRLGDLLDKALEYQMPAVAITDHGNMFGAIEFYEKCVYAGVKPIIGAEVYVAPGSRFTKEMGSGQEAVSNFHLILLCEDLKGYRNLSKLVSAGFKEGFYYKPRIDKELLAEHSEGLIALSACLKGRWRIIAAVTVWMMPWP
jgi:DNA polymerase III subunit alpha